MAPTGQGGQWQDVLCCSLCNQRFEQSFPPVSLICGHVICRKCARLTPAQKKPCPNDDWKPTMSIKHYPTNVALLSIVMTNDNCMNFSDAKTEDERSIDQSMILIAKYFKRAESERGGTVYSQRLSRTLQRKVIALICYQWIEMDGRIKCVKACKAIAERVMTEVLLSIQSNTHVSSQLWSAVRARGCQFLGPAMQEDVLRLILITLENGEKIARKTLVMYVVTTLGPDYPQVSKTCVGHVVQLLYRASCFNVIKREEESSLMQLKEDFRSYDTLRREHDSQIVQIACESGLRIGPDQWSALLYADQTHRSHMQSIIDKLQSPNAYSQCLEELNAALTTNTGTFSLATRSVINEMQPILVELSDVVVENPTFAQLAEYLKKVLDLLKLSTDVDETRRATANGIAFNQDVENRRAGGAGPPPVRFKTKMCANMEKTGNCERGAYCSFAHSMEELRYRYEQQQQQQQQQIIQPTQQMVPIQIAGPPPPIAMVHPARMHYMRGPPPPHPHPPQHPYQMFHPHPHHPMRRNNGMIQPRQNFHPQQPPPPHPMMMVQQPPPGSMMMIPQPPVMAPAQVQQPPPPPSQQQQQQQQQQPPIPPNAMWATATAASPTGPMFPTAPSPPGGQPLPVWVQTTQPFSLETYDYGLIWGTATTLRESGGDAGQLLAKRNEILKRLEPPISIDDDDCEDGGIGHVSYTVASSVLDDTRMDGHHPMILSLAPVQGIDLPPIPVSFATVPTEETMAMIGEMAQQTGNGRPRAPSLTQTGPILAATGQLIQSDQPVVVGAQEVATVQSECAQMSVRDSICQPIVTSAIHPTMNSPTVIPIAAVVATMPPPPLQGADGAPQFVPSVPPPPPGQPMIVDGATGLLTPIIRPIMVPHPQNVVSNSLDKIMDVKERMIEAQGNVSEAENAHLRMELRMAECEMAQIDPYTKNNCLLLELQQVDRELQQLQIDQPTRAQ